MNILLHSDAIRLLVEQRWSE